MVWTAWQYVCGVCWLCVHRGKKARRATERERGRAQGRADVSCVCDLIEMGRSSGVEGREGVEVRVLSVCGGEVLTI